MNYKSIKVKIGSPDALCIFAIPELENRWRLLLAKVSDKEEFLKENPTCTKWALFAEAPQPKKPTKK